MENLEELKTVVVGCGAIGGTLAVQLSENNVDITVVTKYPDLARKIRSEGLELRGVEKQRAIKIKAIPSVSDLAGFFDVVLLATKGNDAEEAAKSVLPFLNQTSVVVTLQNGIIEDRIVIFLVVTELLVLVLSGKLLSLNPALLRRTLMVFFISVPLLMVILFPLSVLTL
ncbi:MAG: 2-dehydropantoate 2-reductase [Candidatus Hodarchaeota archaeon]